MLWNTRGVLPGKSNTSTGSVNSGDDQDKQNNISSGASPSSPMSPSPLSHPQTEEDSSSSSVADIRGNTASNRSAHIDDGDGTSFIGEDDDDEPDFSGSYSGHYVTSFEDHNVLIGHTVMEQQHPHHGTNTSLGQGPSMSSEQSPKNPNHNNANKVKDSYKYNNNDQKANAGLECEPESPLHNNSSIFTSSQSFSQSQNDEVDAHQHSNSASDAPSQESQLHTGISSPPVSSTFPQTGSNISQLHIDGSGSPPLSGNTPSSANSSIEVNASLSSTHSISNSNSSSSSTPPPSAAVIEDDDPGLDHALPPDECAGSLTPSNVWRPQNQQSTCEFTHTIKQYSQKRESGCKKAEYSATTVDVHGNRWRLIVYVNGNGRASNHHLSLFLQVADADELPFGWKKAVSYVLTLEHPSGTNLGYAKRNPDKTFKLCPKAIDWGWSQFITSDRIQQEGYVHNDALIVRASVTVKSSSVSIDVDDAELYLKCAVEEGNADAVKACLAQGAGVNCQFKDDLYTPLHTACSSSTSTGSLEVLKLLLERGADGNACNKWRETPLLIAANNGHRAAVEALLEHGADPSLCSEAGWSALTFAAHKGYDDIVSLLLAAGAPVNCKVTEDLSTPLHKACAGGKPGHLSAVRQLLQGRADVHALNKWRETPLLTAANHGQAAAVEALLRTGGDPCKCTDTGWSPLSIAAYKGHDDVVRLLLEEGAPTEEADPTLSALLQAATKGLPDTVELLLRHGADHTVTTKKGDTALSILVEQNLIDAAVEMVTEYKASVPRCSRDRKKVQRARLLINLRVKQQQKEGLLNGNYNNDGNTESDDSEQDESDDDANLALHSSLDSPISDAIESSKKKKKKKNKLKTRENAEAEARAAEEALLLELEQEDAQAQKEEAAATSKRAKKKKKRERERQQRLKEERIKEEKERKERILREAEEQERLKRQREKEEQEKLRKKKEEIERQMQMKKEAEEREIQQRRMQEQLEQEKREAAKRKAKDELYKKQQIEEKEKKERIDKRSSKSPSPPSVNTNIVKSSLGKKRDSTKVKGIDKKLPTTTEAHTVPDTNKTARNYAPKGNNQSQVNSSKSSTAKKRGWETKNSQQNELSKKTFPKKTHSGVGDDLGRNISNLTLNDQKTKNLNASALAFSVEDELENMANGVVDFLGFDSPPQNAEVTNNHTSFKNNGSPNFHAPIELPAVSSFREEKVVELLRSSSQMGIIEEHILRSVIFRYMIRASHSSSKYLDPVIPSWNDNDFLVAFLQRQLISENRRVGATPGGGGIVRMELLKEAGTALADLCMARAKEVSLFRLKCIEQIPHDWTDEMVGLRAEHVRANGNSSSIIVLDWSGTRQVSFSLETFNGIRNRYFGPEHQFLTAIFTAEKRYELRRLIAGSNVDLHITSSTMATLYSEANVSIEVWTNPLAAFGNNIFLGAFPDVDVHFRGLLPFGKEGGGGEFFLLENGGSVAMLPPLESATAEVYVRTAIDLLERTESSKIPLSFALFLPYECFRELSGQPGLDDLRFLDPRLGEHDNKFIIHVEALMEGQHIFCSGDHNEVKYPGSLFALLQNDEGRMRYAVSERGIANIIRSLSVTFTHEREVATPPPAPVSYPAHPYNLAVQEQDVIGGPDLFSNVYNAEPPRSRRGRFFELEENGEDETSNDVDAMTGMYANLNMSMFQNSSQDVDIEAIACRRRYG